MAMGGKSQGPGGIGSDYVRDPEAAYAPITPPGPTQDQAYSYPPHVINTTAEEEKEKDVDALRRIGSIGGAAGYTPGERMSDEFHRQTPAEREDAVMQEIGEATKKNARRRNRDWWQGKDWPEAAD